VRADRIPKGLQVLPLLGVNSLEAGLFSHPRVVSTDDADAAASVAFEVEPGPAAQARGVNIGESNAGCDGTRAKEECTSILMMVEIIMCILALGEGAWNRTTPKEQRQTWASWSN